MALVNMVSTSGHLMLSDFLHYEVAKTGFVVIKFKQSDANKLCDYWRYIGQEANETVLA